MAQVLGACQTTGLEESVVGDIANEIVVCKTKSFLSRNKSIFNKILRVQTV